MSSLLPGLESHDLCDSAAAAKIEIYLKGSGFQLPLLEATTVHPSGGKIERSSRLPGPSPPTQALLTANLVAELTP